MKVKLTKTQRSIAEVEEWANPEIWNDTDPDEQRKWMGLMIAFDAKNQMLDVTDHAVYELASEFIADRTDVAYHEKRHHDIRSLMALSNKMFDAHYGRKLGEAA